MLTNAPLRLKLLLILIFPLLGFLLLSSVYLLDNYRTLRDMESTVSASSTAQSLSVLITSLQRERGASGVFIGSRGTAMGNRLGQIREESSAAIEAVRRLPTANDSDIAKLLGTLQAITELRQQVSQLSIDSTVSGTRYTEMIQQLIGYTHSLEKRVNNTAVVHALSALNQFIELKERAGRERVILGLAFNQDHFDATLLSRFSRNLGEFSAYADGFQRKASAELLSQFQARQQSPAANEVSRLQRLAFEVPLGQALGIKPEAWFDISTQRIDQMSEVEQALAERVGKLAANAHGNASQALWLTLGGALLALALVALLSWMIIHSIGKAVQDINSALDGLARRDLTARSGYRSKDEFGQIADNLNRMADELGEIVREIGSATAQVATAAEESSAVTLQTSRSVEQQRQSTELVATAINEMSATVREVAHSTNDAANLSQQIHTSTSQGQAEVEGTIELIRELSSQAEQTANLINELKQESDAISSVLDVIRGIAEQTNLLALNAAIEAARAGDHGRGFAVVASEVRTLAQRTQESTGNIQQMISNLQAGSDRASSSMLETLGKAQSGASRIGRAGELLASITEGVARISDRNIQIASAAEEQSAVSEDINRNVNAINDLVIQVSAGAQQTAVTSQELARLAEHQQQLVSRFRLA
ncbi:HAMP domain-containing protein [Pseudomonas oryziphila]|uniref:HAMP domain-containing protein n=2 Tax=Pseudomonas TaxID=286 RepID=A0A3Q8U488_9PSED|nr:methyl-accepting chemotaxis protein [Pseudomonas oryziphila]AZL70313.1 HAMP domain-containing protein [Pseudomonas oryziphila]